MNRIFSLVSICILLSVLFSCKKNNNFSTGGTITATVNGVPYTSASVTGEAHPTGAPGSFSIFTSINDSKTTSIILYIDSLTPGIYSYNNGKGNALQYNSEGITYGTVPGSPGSIIVTSAANSITGTFSGVLGTGTADSIIITDGVFTNCAY